ncbi:MAG: alkaline phosphatase family protein [Actinomycetota bacterium]|nr:alkaline phosphatase family protein [Actinomycetota bacterium]
MTARVGTLAAVMACAASLLTCGSASPGRSLDLGAPGALPASRSSHVVEIVMENKEDADILGSRDAPYANGLARRYGVATASFAITHPSLPNYLALTSGSTHGITDDCTDCHVAGANLVDQLEAARVSWKAYMEDLPRRCYRGAKSHGYVKKHDPFLYYDDVARSPARCRKVVGFAALTADLRKGALPTFAFISPNLCHDSHDCGVSTGDQALARLVPGVLRELGPHGFLVLTWDEGRTDRGCCSTAHGGRIATIVAGPDVLRGGRHGVPVDHYGVLRSVENALGLSPLAAAADPSHGSLAPLFRRTPRVR